ncbi:MAG TPA: hypothetical protein VG940_00925 [Gemmatimonadales bacterium]|nr:hypothetical protein [Gemmatimonadales bacterium]
MFTWEESDAVITLRRRPLDDDENGFEDGEYDLDEDEDEDDLFDDEDDEDEDDEDEDDLDDLDDEGLSFDDDEE